MKSDEVFLVTARDKSVSAATLVRFSAFLGRLLYFDMSPAQALLLSYLLRRISGKC